MNTSSWSKEKREWILKTDQLFSDLFGGDFLTYKYHKEKGTDVNESIISSLVEYNHDQWEKNNYLPLDENVREELSPNQNAHTGNATKESSKQKHVSKKLAFHGQAQSVKNEMKTTQATTFPTHKFIIIQDDECEDDMQTSSSDENSHQRSQLLSLMSTAKTRAELASLACLIPPVHSSFSCTEVTSDCVVYTNPYCLSKRPCESVVERAQTLLSNERRKGSNPTGVVINGIGHFSVHGLSVLKQFSSISETKCKVTAEAQWLSQVTSSPGELTLLQNILWNSPTRIPLLRSGQKVIDIISFSDLCEERYIDCFLVDVCISKFVEEARIQGGDETLFLPTDFFQWMQTDDRTFKLSQLTAKTSQMSKFNDLKQILIPVYMVNHWGLIYLDLANQELYFDDGLASHVPPTTLPHVKEALEFLLELHPCHPYLQTKFWHSCKTFSRFGMPSQMPVDKKMIGSGSCGIGVIMAARDFIRIGSSNVNNILWRYCNMDTYRKELMLQILRWAGYNF